MVELPQEFVPSGTEITGAPPLDIATLPSVIVASVPPVKFEGTPKLLYGPAQPGTSAATAYTVPASTRTDVEFISATNTTANPATITVSIGADAAATRIIDALELPPHGVLTMPCKYSLVATTIIQVTQGTASAISLTIQGTEHAV